MGHSFAEVHPELVCEWSEKNAPLKATDITYGSNKRYWWIGKCGECGYEWQSVVYTRVHGGLCPVCAARKGSVGINDLMTTNPEIAEDAGILHHDEGVDLLPSNIELSGMETK
jgi:hypothetical protein